MLEINPLAGLTLSDADALEFYDYSSSCSGVSPCGARVRAVTINISSTGGRLILGDCPGCSIVSCGLNVPCEFLSFSAQVCCCAEGSEPVSFVWTSRRQPSPLFGILSGSRCKMTVWLGFRVRGLLLCRSVTTVMVVRIPCELGYLPVMQSLLEHQPWW